MRLRPVVLVEDCWSDAELACATLGAAGLENPLLVLRDGHEALAYFRDCIADPWQQEPALVLLDLGLPGVDGRDILSLIKADKKLHRLPLVVVTGAEPELAFLGYHGLDTQHAITKPLTIAKLARAASLAGAWLELGSRSSPGLRIVRSPATELVL